MILKILEEVQAAKGKAKIDVLRRHKDNDTLKNVLRFAYDKTNISYYTKSFTPRDPHDGAHHTLDTTLDELEYCIVSRKITGDKAQLCLDHLAGNLLKRDRKVLEMIIDRDCRCGVNVKSINKAFGTPVIEIHPYMRCTLLTESNKSSLRYPITAQLKADGAYVAAHVDRNKVTFKTRSGNDIVGLGDDLALEVVHSALHVPCVFTGEIVLTKNGVVQPRELGNGIITSLIKGGEIPPEYEPLYQVWDLIPSVDYHQGEYAVPYSTRHAEMTDGISPQSRHLQAIETRQCNDFNDVSSFYKEVTAQGREGLVLKTPSGIWKDGTSKDQYKVKVAFQCDLRFVSFIEAAKNSKHKNTFGSILTESSDGKLRVSVNGRTDAMRADLWARRDTLNEYTVFTVESNNILPPSDGNPDYSLFLPVFIEERFDKDEADDIGRIKEQLVASIEAGRMKS